MEKKIIIKNSVFGFYYQIIQLSFSFIVRPLLIKYIGTDLLGLNGTVASLIAAFSLTDAGFSTAILFRLYKPFNEDDSEEIGKLIDVYKRIYRVIAICVLIIAILVSFFLPLLLKKIIITPQIYVYYFLQVASTVSTYLLAYRRCLFQADQKEYLLKIIDSVFFIITQIGEIIAVVIFRSYGLYLIIALIGAFLPNFVIEKYSKKKYELPQCDKIDKELLSKVVGDSKYLFVGAISAFVFNNTDSIIISSFIATSLVTVVGNYMIVKNGICTIGSSIISPTLASIGRMNSNKNVNKDTKFQYFKLHSHSCYLICSIILVPTSVVINDFIKLWVGSSFLLKETIVLLVILQIYLWIVPISCGDFLTTNGLFKQSRTADFLAMVLNLGFSIVLLNVLGLIGIFIGTVIGQFVAWIYRSAVIMKEVFFDESLLKYWIKHILYFVVFLINAHLVNILFNRVYINEGWIGFLIGGLIIFGSNIIIINIELMLLSKEHRYIWRIIKNYIKKSMKGDV